MNIDKRAPVGVGVIVRCGDYILLGKRKGAHGAGQWALPGGKPDGGEDPWAAAIRELREETNLSVPSVAAVPSWTYDRFPEDSLHYVTLYFKVHVDPNEAADLKLMEPDKCEEWRWVFVYGASSGQRVGALRDADLFCGIEQLALRGLL